MLQVTTLVLVALAECHDKPPPELLLELHHAGFVVYTTHGSGGCLRAATSLGPETIYLDAALPHRLRRLLRAHPVSARAKLCRLPSAAFAPALLVTTLRHSAE